ncbi:MAG: ATP-binding cassette domain-containing protein, partial [Solirubrobacteraceae bacterium]
MAPRNLVNLHKVAKGYGSRAVLHDVTLGVTEGERVGIVGENGAGKSTLMRLLAGAESPDQGTATHTTGLNAVLVSQRVDLAPESTVRAELVGGRPDHEWARDAAIREVLDGLLGG